MAEPEKPKKRPGRPRKAASTVASRAGVVTELQYEAGPPAAELQNIVKIEYDNPTMYKHIFSAFKQLGAATVHVRFMPDRMRMYCVDHTKTNRMHVTLYGNQMVSHYVESQYDVAITPSEFQNVLNAINVNHTMIAFSTLRTDSYKKLTITLVNPKNAITSKYDTNISRDDEAIWHTVDNLPGDQYDLRFDMECKAFKKIISSTEALSKLIKIEKNGTRQLKISFEYETGTGTGEHEFTDSALIKLETTIDPTRAFSISVPILYIKPVANMVLTDNVRMSVRADSDIISEFFLDQKTNAAGQFVPDSHSCVVRFYTTRV